MIKKIWIFFRPFVRGFYRIINGLNGFIYDFKRYLRFSGWTENLKDLEQRNYSMVMAYHGLEKSLSYKKRNPSSGWGNAERVFSKIKMANEQQDFGYHDKAAVQVLIKFLDLPSNREKPRAKEMLSFIDSLKVDSPDSHGAIELSIDSYYAGKLENPEQFFLSRYSLREFRDEKVPKVVLERAIKLAMKTPSVCNRQEWHIYHSDNNDIIKEVLKYQNGNRPFGQNVQNLLVVTTDLKAFFAGSEHYQHWIDGGLFSMSLMYAFHSLGIASCPLNWSQTPKKDKQLRRAISLKNNHTVMMMIAFGFPNDVNKVCSSSRRPAQEIFSKIELK